MLPHFPPFRIGRVCIVYELVRNVVEQTEVVGCLQGPGVGEQYQSTDHKTDMRVGL